MSLQERKLLEHHETELCSPSHRFGPTVRIELGENGGDVKLGGVEGDAQPTCDRFVGNAVRHRSKYFELAGGLAVRGLRHSSFADTDGPGGAQQWKRALSHVVTVAQHHPSPGGTPD